jgi:hypothetical protein
MTKNFAAAMLAVEKTRRIDEAIIDGLIKAETHGYIKHKDVALFIRSALKNAGIRLVVKPTA